MSAPSPSRSRCHHARRRARALTGGTDLIPHLRGAPALGRVVDLEHVAELTTISALPDGGIAIGAAATATVVSRHATIAANYPPSPNQRASSAACRCRTGRASAATSATRPRRPMRFRHSCATRPAPSSPGPMDAASWPWRRSSRVPARLSLEPGELLVAILLPPPQPRSAAKYLRFTPRREMDIAIAGAGTWLRLDADGAIAEARIVLASVGPTPMRAPTAEQKLAGERPTRALLEEAGRLAAGDARPISDTRGSADYRRSLVAVLTARALADCCRQLGIEVATP